MVTIRQERPADVAAREALLDLSYGPVRFNKPSARLREGRAPELALVVAEAGRVVGTVRLWEVLAGHDRPALLLGPLAVHPQSRNRGIGSALMERALHDATRRRHGAVLLVGDTAYYGRFGFSPDTTSGLWLPGHYEPDRLLGRELFPGALAGAQGPLRGCSRLFASRKPAKLVGRRGRQQPFLAPHAA